MKLSYNGVKFFSKYQGIQLCLYIMLLGFAYIEKNDTLIKFMMEFIFLALMIDAVVLVRGNFIEQYVNGVVIRTFIKILSFLSIIMINGNVFNQIYIKDLKPMNIYGIVIFCLFSFLLLVIYKRIHDQHIKKIRNITFYNAQPRYELPWYISYISLLLCATIFEEILRSIILFILIVQTQFGVLFVFNIIFFEIYHLSSRYYRLDYKQTFTRGVLSSMCFVLSVILQYPLLSIFLHLLYNSFALRHVINLYFIKEKGRKNFVIKI